MKYISIKIEPNGKIPPKATMTQGSMYHFFSGIGLGTAFTLQVNVSHPFDNKM